MTRSRGLKHADVFINIFVEPLIIWTNLTRSRGLKLIFFIIISCAIVHIWTNLTRSRGLKRIEYVLKRFWENKLFKQIRPGLRGFIYSLWRNWTTMLLICFVGLWGRYKIWQEEIKDPKKDYSKNPFLTVSSAFNGFLLRPARIQLNTRQR